MALFSKIVVSFDHEEGAAQVKPAATNGSVHCPSGTVPCAAAAEQVG